MVFVPQRNRYPKNRKIITGIILLFLPLNKQKYFTRNMIPVVILPRKTDTIFKKSSNFSSTSFLSGDRNKLKKVALFKN